MRSKQLIFFLALIMISVVAAGQTDTLVVVQPEPIPEDGNIFDWVAWFWNNLVVVLGNAITVLLAFEATVRVIPTKNNWSIITRMIIFLERIRGFNLFKNRGLNGKVFVLEVREKEDE